MAAGVAGGQLSPVGVWACASSEKHAAIATASSNRTPCIFMFIAYLLERGGILVRLAFPGQTAAIDECGPPTGSLPRSGPRSRRICYRKNCAPVLGRLNASKLLQHEHACG